MIRSRHFSETELQRIVDAADQDIDTANQQAMEQDRFDRVAAWCADKNNAAQLREIQAEFARLDAAHQRRSQPQPAAPASRFAPGTPQNPIPANARFSPRDLLYDRPSYGKIVDPKV